MWVKRDTGWVKRVKGGKALEKGSENAVVFDDTAGVYRAKWLGLSIQLKWIKGCNEWQTNLAPLATQFPQPDLLSLLCPTVLTSAPLLPPLSPLPSPSPVLIPAPLFSPLYACVTLNLLFHKSHSAICIASEPPARLANTSAPIPLFHVKKIRSADWFVFVSCCSAAATAIGNP